MQILSGQKNVAKVLFLLTLDWAYDDDSRYETLLFSRKEDAIAEFDAQLNHLKTFEFGWEREAIQAAADENDYSGDVDREFLKGEYDYLNDFTYGLNELIAHPNTDILLKSFVIYQNDNEVFEHTYLTLRAVCVMGD